MDGIAKIAIGTERLHLAIKFMSSQLLTDAALHWWHGQVACESAVTAMTFRHKTIYIKEAMQFIVPFAMIKNPTLLIDYILG